MSSLRKYFGYTTKSEHRNISIKQYVNYYLPLCFLTLIVLIGFMINIPYLYADTSAEIWPCFRHDAQHTGRSPYVGPQTHNLRWQIGGGENVVISSPVIGSDGTIYIGYSDPNRCALYALVNDPDPNIKVKVKWSYPTQGDIISTPAIGPDGRIYFGCRDNKIYALNPNGTLKGSYKTGGEVNSSPVIGPDGTIYVGSYDGHLYAINPDGTLRQSYQTETLERILSSPAIGKDGTIFFGSFDNSPYTIDPNGKIEKAPPTGGDILSSFAIGSDGAIYLASYDNNLYSVDPNGNLRIYELGGEILSSPAIEEDGTVYIGCNDGKVYAIDPTDPNDYIKWTFQTGDQVISSPALGADGTIYIGSNDKNVYALTPSGELKWSYKTGGGVGTSPAIGDDGTVYIASGDGKVYAFRDTIDHPCIFTAEIRAIGQTLPDIEYNNISTVSIGIDTYALAEEAPPSPPKNTVVLTLAGDAYELKKDIRASGSEKEEWRLSIVVGGSGSVANPNKPGYFPVLSWDPDEFCPPGQNSGFIELWSENSQGVRTLLIPDMTQASQYQTKKEDGDCSGKICVFTYYIIWSKLIQVEMNFSAGWSMMSLPLIIHNPTPSKLFPEAAVIYAYKEGSGYVIIKDDEEMQVGSGYWILFYEDQNYVLRGQPIPSYSKTVYSSGWKMIGGCTSGSRPTADSCDIGVIYKYEKGAGYKLIPKSKDLNPGEGFWILLKEVADQCQITVEPTAPSNRIRACYVNN